MKWPKKEWTMRDKEILLDRITDFLIVLFSPSSIIYFLLILIR
nr:MAG TPA: hypothetical protein [Crassvirales sp.]